MTGTTKVAFVAGVARSGTSWIGQILNSAPSVAFRFQPLFSYELKSQVDEASSSADFAAFFDRMYRTDTTFLTQRDKRESGVYPDFYKAADPDYLIFKENRYQSIFGPMLRRVPGLRGIGVVRHPCAVLNSWRKNEHEFPKGSDIIQEWRFADCKNLGSEDYFGFYKWREVANLYLDLAQQHPERFLVLRYEDVVDDCETAVAQMFAFLDLELTEATSDFIVDSTSNHQTGYYSVYKDQSVTESWRREFDPGIVAEIEAELRGTRLQYFLG